jgi:hypothetical protein
VLALAQNGIAYSSFIPKEGLVYVIRRVWVVQYMQARLAASIAAEIAKEYERVGQRSDVRIYYNGGTMPGDRNRVYMEWVTDSIQSPHREGNDIPARATELQAKMRELQTDSWLEFNELMTPEKMLPLDE